MTTVIKKATQLIATMRKLRNSLTKKNPITAFYKLYIRIDKVEQSHFCESNCSAAARLNREKDLKPLISDGRDENISSDRKITEYWYEVGEL